MGTPIIEHQGDGSSKMPPKTREPWRNVHFYNASTGEALGGFYQAGSLTEETLIWSLGTVVLILDDSWTVKHRESGRIITPSKNPVVPGDYDVSCTGPIQLSKEPWFPRPFSYTVSGPENTFCQRVRQRDGRDVIPGTINGGAEFDIWTGYHAVHVFPLDHESLWPGSDYQRYIKGIDISSPQNGLLMTATLQSLFDQYMFTINPDDGYKIITFVPSSWGHDGRTLDPVCRDPKNPDHVSDGVLRWHFRQSILANMRGLGEPGFEMDFPPGSDMMASMRAEPYSKERFEIEIASRLRRPAKARCNRPNPYLCSVFNCANSKIF